MSGRRAIAAAALVLGLLAAALTGCAHMGRLRYVPQTMSPTPLHSPSRNVSTRTYEPIRPLFGDTLIGLVPGTGDTSRRYLGRLRDGYTTDTLNVLLFGDNRPGLNWVKLAPERDALRQMLSPNPIKIVRGLVTIPWMLIKGLYPNLGLIRDLPAAIRHQPVAGREHSVMSAMLVKVDSLKQHGQIVAAAINSGDLVEDGRYPAHWERFLRITRPLSSRVPYFAVAGNHERTDTPDGVENWRAATGLPVGGDRLYYCFDSADGWVRFIALDTNPIVDPGSHWSREVQIKYSNEEFTWLVARVKEHVGPVIVMMHHAPFSAGFHHVEWQRDTVLSRRRERMVRALHDAGISVIVGGHEHSYQRALLTWPDAVLIAIVTGGAGAPLHPMAPPAQVAQTFAEYKVAGSIVRPENVFSAEAYNFTLLRLWFGGGALFTYAVDKSAKTKQIDYVHVDLTRYGVPRIDQHKIPIPPAKGLKESPKAEIAHKATSDTTKTSARLLSKPAPGKRRAHPVASGRPRSSRGQR